jgi:hypothetical protein
MAPALRTSLIIGAALSAVLVVRGLDARQRARESALTAKALADVSQSLDRVAGTQAALEVRVAGLAAAVGAGPAPAPARLPGLPPAPATPTPAAPDDERPRSPEVSAASAAALAVVTEAVHAGQWTENDKGRIREALASSDLETRTEVVRQLSAAVNSGKVQMRVAASPF